MEESHDGHRSNSSTSGLERALPEADLVFDEIMRFAYDTFCTTRFVSS